MSDKKDMFDAKAIRRARGVSERWNARQANVPFLYERCVEDVCERLADVNRNFANVLVIGAPEILLAIKNRLKAVGQDTPSQKLGHIIHINHTDDLGSTVIFDGENLPFSAGAFDLVLNLFNLHSVNDVTKNLIECRRVLTADGLMIASFLGGNTLRELRQVLYASEDQIYGQITPRIAPMIRLDQGGALLQHCGYTMPVIDRDLVNIRYGDLATLYGDLKQMGVRNRLSQRSKRPVSKRFFTKIENLYKQDFCDEASKSSYRASFEIIWLTGWQAHPDQPKPLKPGSAKTSLAHALGVHEQKLKT